MRNKNDRPTRKASGKRLTVALICLALSLVCGITLAHLFTNTDSLENIFTPASVGIDITETFENNVKENVKVKNTGDTECYIRATIVVTWKNNDNDGVYPKMPEFGVDYTMTMGSDGNWVQAKDGFWYYKLHVAAGDSTANLIDLCKPIEGKTPDGYYLSVEIISSAIQSNPTDVVKSQWNSGGNGVIGVDGTTLLVNEKEVAKG